MGTDARGRPAKVTIPPAIMIDGAFSTEEFRRLHGAKTRAQELSGVARALTTLSFLAFGIVALRILPATRLSLGLVMLVMLVLCWALLEYAKGGRVADALAGEYLALTRCPTCTYRLKGLPLEADGCTLCPECGAAWRLPEAPPP